MVRVSAVIVGSVLLLGAAGTSRAQDASAFGLTTDASSLAWGALSPPAWGGVFWPKAPQNWSDLPFQLRLSEGVGYNNNVNNLPSNISTAATILRGGKVGAFESLTTIGVNTKAYVYGEEFFASGTFGLNRYLNHTNLNTNQYSANTGMNWTYTSRCSGTLVAAVQKSQSEPGQQIGIGGINTTTTESFNETGTCGVSSNYSAILNSGTTSSANSLPADALNNYQNVFVSAGISYNVTSTNILQLLATLSDYDYPNRQAFLLATSGLTQNQLSKTITNNTVNLSYTRDWNPNLSFIASVGLAGVSFSSFGLAKSFVPQYSLSVNWRPTAKTTLAASVARVVTPPTAIVANLQTNESVSLTGSYDLTPKISVSAGASVSHSSASGSNNGQNIIVINGITFFQSQTNYSLRTSVGYAMTPFVTTNLSYQYSRSVSNNSIAVTPNSIVLMNVSYGPF